MQVVSSSKNSFWPILISLSAIIFAVWYYWYRPPPPTQLETTGSNIKKIVQPNVLFYTKVFQKNDQTFITFPYKFDQKPSTVVLTLQAKIGTPAIQRLVMHPLLYNLNWPKKTASTLSLYQKNATYSSVEAFLKNPPESQTIAVDDTALPYLPEFFDQAKILEPDAQTLTPEINYILTTYKTPETDQDWYVFSSLIDATTAQPNGENELNWLLLIPDASADNAFYLGNIQVDYRQ